MAIPQSINGTTNTKKTIWRRFVLSQFGPFSVTDELLTKNAGIVRNTYVAVYIHYIFKIH